MDYRATKRYGKNFRLFTRGLGFTDEQSFWHHHGGVTGTTTDNIVAALDKWAVPTGMIDERLDWWINNLTLQNNKSDAIATLPLMGKGLTFYKDFTNLTTGTHASGDLNANFSMGSATATFTATRGAANPATYVDDNGVIQLTTTSDVARICGGYYDATGFHAQKGLMVEGAGTNLATRGTFPSDSDSDGVADSWSFELYSTVTGTPVYTTATNSLSNISGFKSQRAVYTGVAGDAGGKSITLSFISSVAASANTVYTISFYGKINSESGVTNVIEFMDRTAADGFIQTQSSSEFTMVSGKWARYSATFTSSATTGNCRVRLRVSSIDPGDSVDIEYAGVQLEQGAYATSLIPTTTTAALTRNAEVLKYAISGNRTAASESCFIVFNPMWDSSVQANKYILETEGTGANDGERRFFGKFGNDFGFRADAGQTTNIDDIVNTSWSANDTLSIACVCQSGVSPYEAAYYNGSPSGTNDTTNDFTAPNMGTYFFVGSADSPDTTGNISVKSIAFFSDAKSATDVASITTLLGS